MDDQKNGLQKKFNTPEEERALVLDHVYNFTPANLQQPATIAQACAMIRGERLAYHDQFCPIVIKVSAKQLKEANLNACGHVEVKSGKWTYCPAKSNQNTD